MVNKNIIDIQNAKFVVTNTGFFGIDTANPSAKLQVGNTLYVDDTNGKVGINKATPDEVLDINGTLRIEADRTQTIRFYDTQGGGSPDENGRIEIDKDSGGGEMKFYTLETGGGTPNERLSINRRGALGLSGNYGTGTQFLKSNGSGGAVSWDTPIDTTYTNGTGISISPSNVISIGQDVSMTANVFFASLTIGSQFTVNNQGAFGLGTNPNFGTDGQVLTSQGTNTAIWGPPNKYFFYHGDYEPFGLGCLGGFVGMNAGDIYYSAFYTSNSVDYKKITLYTSEDFISFTGNLGVAIYSDSVNLPGNLLFKHKETYSAFAGIGSFELDLTLDETFSLNSHTKYWLGVSVNTTNYGTMGLAKALITDTDNVHIRKGTGYTTATEFPTNAGVSFTDSPLNFWFRLYNPDATSFNQQTDSPDSLSIFKTNVDLLEAKIETETDVSGTGSSLIFKTLDSTGVLTEKTRINNVGAIGIGGSNYGLENQVLTSNGTNGAVRWTTPATVVLNNGTNINITGTYPNFTINNIAPSVPSNLVETYINRKTLSGTGATDFFTINRDIQRSFVVDLRIVGGDGINICTLYHTRSGIVFTGSEIFIKPNEIIANTSFTGGGSAYTTSIIEAPSNVQLDIRVNSATGGTQTVAAYMTLYGTRTNPTVVIS